MWHVKDMDKIEKKFFTEVGNGTIDFKKIFAQCQEQRYEVFLCGTGCLSGLAV